MTLFLVNPEEPVAFDLLNGIETRSQSPYECCVINGLNYLLVTLALPRGDDLPGA
jgi:hypothetical protein